MLLRAATVLAAPALALVLAACTAGPTSGGAPAVRVVPAVVLAPQPLPPPPATRLAAPVAEGTVLRLAGPFDGRLAVTGTQLREGRVDASLRLDPGVVVLEAVAHFYDADGALLGSTRQSHAPGTGAALALELPAPPGSRSRVVSATLQVPVLVHG